MLTADTYTSVLMTIHLKIAEGPPDWSWPPRPATQPAGTDAARPGRRRPQRLSYRPGQNPCGPGETVAGSAAKVPAPTRHTDDTQRSRSQRPMRIWPAQKGAPPGTRTPNPRMRSGRSTVDASSHGYRNTSSRALW
jgi:hypothetical protein